MYAQSLTAHSMVTFFMPKEKPFSSMLAWVYVVLAIEVTGVQSGEVQHKNSTDNPVRSSNEVMHCGRIKCSLMVGKKLSRLSFSQLNYEYAVESLEKTDEKPWMDFHGCSFSQYLYDRLKWSYERPTRCLYFKRVCDFSF